MHGREDQVDDREDQVEDHEDLEGTEIDQVSVSHGLRELRYDAEVMTIADPNGKLTWKRSRDVVTKYDRPDVWDALPNVDVPTLVVRGADSTLLRHDVALRMVEAIPDSRLAEIPDGGHWSHLEHPDDYERIVTAFLAN